MEKQELMKAVEQYFSYWRTYVHPLVDKEPRLYIHFTDTLNQVRHFERGRQTLPRRGIFYTVQHRRFSSIRT